MNGTTCDRLTSFDVSIVDSMGVIQIFLKELLSIVYFFEFFENYLILRKDMKSPFV